MLALRLIAVVSLCVACASSSNSGGSSGSCSSIAGTWTIKGACGDDTCVITQNGCATNFVCGGGSVSYAGSVDGTNVSYSGKTAAGAQGSCTGTLNGTSMSGTCALAGGSPCNFTASKN